MIGKRLGWPTSVMVKSTEQVMQPKPHTCYNGHHYHDNKCKQNSSNFYPKTLCSKR